MDKLNSYRTYSHADRIQNTLKSAQKRADRNDYCGASDTIRNCYRWIAYKYGIELANLKPIEGTELDVCEHLESGNMQFAIQVLKHIEVEVLNGKYRF